MSSLLADVPFFEGLDSGALALIAGCGRQRPLRRRASTLFREGDPADTFYVVRHGSVALETFVPARGPVVIETIDAGEVVGWSWLFAAVPLALRRARADGRARDRLRRRLPAAEVRRAILRSATP